MDQDLTLAFVGAGNMAGALIRGLVSTGTVAATQIVAADPDRGRLQSLESELGIRVTRDNETAVNQAGVVILATKPQMFAGVLPSVADAIRDDALVISIAAGISTSVIEAALRPTTRVVRTMPNTPALVGRGATAVAGGAHANDQDLALATRLFESVGLVVRVPEAQIDAVTGVSGSGPAYVFAMIEALRDAGAREGLAPDTALLLAAHTVRGAAALLLDREEPPELLRQKVTSPGGTTLAGLQALDKQGFRDAVHAAVRAATRRSEELGRIEADARR
ncbi:MAG: pyrroline-5-carboxylate reductase [Myxococcota bacterium]